MSETYAVFETSHGYAGIAWNGRAVTNFALPAPTGKAASSYMHRRAPLAHADHPPAWIAQIIADARRYFLGEIVDFSGVPLEMTSPEPFFSRVYAHVRSLRWGETTTYGQIARDLGE